MTMNGEYLWIISLCCLIARLSAQDQDGSGERAVLDENVPTEGNTTAPWDSWFPKVNATCKSGALQLSSNPSCVAGKLKQTRTVCQDSFKTNGKRGCVTSEREISCSVERACSPWTEPRNISECCNKKTCIYNNTVVSYSHALFVRTRTCGDEMVEGCDVDIAEGDCITGRASPGGNADISGADPKKSNSIQIMIFGFAGTVMVGLLLFAVIRLRRVTAQKRGVENARDRGSVNGVDNEALMNLPSESRVQAILNNMNANGHQYELRERPDSTPGRRVYVISPTDSQANLGRGRVFSRATSQLSSIAEESTDDALSRITEGTEPLEDDCVFKYDSDAINEINNEDSAFSEETPKPASSAEAINCINDVIALYDVDTEANNEITEMLKRSSVKSQNDFRISRNSDEYLSDFGWRPPQERTWTVAKLKDENVPRTDRRMSASCSTLNSMYLSNMSIASKDTTSNGAVSDDNVTEPLLSKNDMTSSNLKQMKAFSSMPTILDTSQIPDIAEIIAHNEDEAL